MKHRLHIFSFVLAVVLLLPLPVRAVDTSYYSSLDGTSGTTLWSAVHTVAKTGYSSLSYSGLWTAYGTTDLYPAGHEKAGKIWDLYSYCTSYTLGTDQDSGSGSTEGTVYNREHSIPKSWFGGSTSNNTPGTDIFHVYPTDKVVNGKRSNYALGEVTAANATYSSNKGCGGYSSSDLAGYSRLGTGSSITISNTIITSGSTTQSPTSSPVFEPLAEYKGDLARSYFGTMLRWAGDYAAFTTDEGSSMFSGTYTAAGKWGLTSYGVALLMKWHREDPVSQKEIDRNNAIQSTQGNRNPFIDYPILAEYFWGKYSGNTFNRSNAVPSFDTSNFTPGVSDGDKNSTGPTLTVSSSSITISPIATSSSTTQTFTVTGANLTGAISIAKSGSSYITVSPTSIPASSANGTNTITITYNAPSSAGSHNATLTISSTGAENVTVTINASCATPKTITWNVDGSEYTTGGPTISVGSGGNVTKLPTAPTVGPSGCTSKVFKGWSETEIGSTPQDAAPSDLFTTTSATACQNITSNKTFYAIFATETTVSGGGTVSDTINRSKTASALGSTATSTWASDFTITGNTGAVYTIHSMGTSGGTHALQWNTNGYLYCSTTNGNKLKSVKVTTLANKNVTIYGNATAYTAKATATQLNTLAATTSGATYTFTSDYYAIGINGAASSTQVSEIIISYEGGSTTTYSDYVTQCTACAPVVATASYAYPTRTTTCGGTVSNAFTTNSNATVSYASSNTSVATVASDGTITPTGAGTTTITATVPANTCFTGGASASFSLTVNRTTGTASFSGATTTVNKDATVTNVVTTNSDGAVTYSSSNTSVATVNASGVVTGVSAGTATITANVAQSTCYTAASANYTITVYDFKANAATDVTCESFTANWNTSGAASYSLDVYQGTSSSTTVSRDTTITYDFVSALTWTSQYVSGTSDIWSHNTTYGAYGKGASGTASESWLISPELDFSDVTTASLTMNHTFRYGESSQLSVKYSTDGGSTWNNATLSNWGDGNNWTFVDATADLSATCGSAHVKLAFVYTCTKSSYATWEIKTLSISGTYNKTISTSSVEHVSGYPKNVSGTSASVTGLDASTTYKYTVTPQGGSASNEIEVTTPACSCTRTITATTADDSMGTVGVTLP